jgi:septal ring factor EnvC (AmiA/AmiB activator)
MMFIGNLDSTDKSGISFRRLLCIFYARFKRGLQWDIALISLLLVLMFSATIAEASVWDRVKGEARRAWDDAGDVLEEAWRDTRKLYTEAEEEIRKVRELEKWVREARDKTKAELRRMKADLRASGQRLKAEAERSREKIARAKTELKNLSDKIKRISDSDVARYAFSNKLTSSIVAEIQRGHLNEFLDTQLVGNLRLYDVLMPTYGLLEHLDVTGMTQCLRETEMIKRATTTAQGGFDTAIAPNIPQVRDSVYECLSANSDPATEQEAQRAQLEQQIAEQQVQANRQQREKYEKELREEKERQELIQDRFDNAADRLEILAKQQEAIENQMAELLSELDNDPLFAELDDEGV